MANIAKWIAGAQAFSSGNLADNTAMASRALGYFNICQVAAADVVIDNATNLDQFLAVTISLGSWTPTITDWLELYTCYAPDGTNYETGSSTYLPEPDRIWQAKELSTNTTAGAKLFTVIGEIRPFKFKLVWRWQATNSTAASANLMTWQTFNTNLNG